MIAKHAAAVFVAGGALLGGCAPPVATVQPVQPGYSEAWAAQQRAALRAYLIEQQNARQFPPDNIDEPRRAMPVSLPKPASPDRSAFTPQQVPPRHVDPPTPLALRPALPPVPSTLRPLVPVDTGDCWGYWRICHFF